ncbi:FHA domain-containing protein [Sporosarcina sp. FSL K6-3457]|uniref:FHA domain-containing protein n=1 Tax=Sporosarcina sp. FSL K6-3457 TaxID=2978204 RepID=UPI0030FAD350
MIETNNSFDTNVQEVKSNHKMSILVIDIFIILLALLIMVYIFLVGEIIVVKYIVGILLAIVGIGYALMKYESKNFEYEDAGTGITKLYLLNEQGEKMNEWLIEGETSLLIGKSSSEREVDIDLSTTEYESLINNDHAVLNCVSGIWYIEDIDSLYGIGIKKAEKRIKSKLRHESHYRINTGDILYIANTRLLVK